MKVALLVPLAVATSLLAGCMADSQCVADAHGGGVAFACQAAGKTGTHTYTFQNSFGTAHVDMGSQIASGTLTVTVKDASGARVFERTYSGANQAGESTTSAGAPGTWSVTMKFVDVTGQIALDVAGAGSPL